MRSLKSRLKISDERLEAVTDVINAHYDPSATDAEVYHHLDWGWNDGERWIESATDLELVHWVKYRLPNVDLGEGDVKTCGYYVCQRDEEAELILIDGPFQFVGDAALLVMDQPNARECFTISRHKLEQIRRYSKSKTGEANIRASVERATGMTLPERREYLSRQRKQRLSNKWAAQVQEAMQ